MQLHVTLSLPVLAHRLSPHGLVPRPVAESRVKKKRERWHGRHSCILLFLFLLLVLLLVVPLKSFSVCSQTSLFLPLLHLRIRLSLLEALCHHHSSSLLDLLTLCSHVQSWLCECNLAGCPFSPFSPLEPLVLTPLRLLFFVQCSSRFRLYVVNAL